MTQNETRLIEQKDLRDQCIAKVEVLDKVKELFLLPGMEMTSTKMVADYYEVDEKVIYQCYSRNKKEINPDGVSVKKQKEFLIRQDVETEKLPYKVVLHLGDGVTFDVPNCGLRMFSKRAVLRIGMLLRDSRVAQEVRTQLLNTFEVATVEQKTAAITTEQCYLFSIQKAFNAGDFDMLMDAVNDLRAFHERHIAALNETLEGLQREIDDLEFMNGLVAQHSRQHPDRILFSKAVRAMSAKSDIPAPLLYNQIYGGVARRFHIPLYKRRSDAGGVGCFADYVEDEEWDIVWQVTAAVCVDHDINFAEVCRAINKEM